MTEKPSVVAVDLDGTLIASDMLHESFWGSVTSDFGAVVRGVGDIASGQRARLKERLASGTSVDVTTLPYKNEVVEEIKRARSELRSPAVA